MEDEEEAEKDTKDDGVQLPRKPCTPLPLHAHREHDPAKLEGRRRRRDASIGQVTQPPFLL